MPKFLRDLRPRNKAEKINLDSSDTQKSFRLKIDHHTLSKKNTPITKIKDLTGAKQVHYRYIKGENFSPPKYLGNLIKIALVGFLLMFFINSVAVYSNGKKLEKEITAQAFEGYGFLVDAGKSATKIQFEEALNAFQKASDNFSEAENNLWFISTDSSLYAQGDDIGYAANAMLESGKYFAKAGTYFLEAIEEFNKIPVYFVSKNRDPNQPIPSLTDALKQGLQKTDLAIAEIDKANQKISKINSEKLPAEIQARVTFAKKQIEDISTTLNSISSHFPALLKLLGDRYPHRILILFQNNNEIRPTGGFIGSYGIMDLNEGYIEKLETHDVYDIDGAYGGIIEPPEELKAFTKNWRFRDSNYSPDFPTSAAKARWFLQKEGGPSVDTVIAINQGLLRDMLEITGPVQVGNFGKLNSENYNLLLSYIIESKIWGAEDPKHILKVFVPAFKEAILQEENLSHVASKLYKAIQQKHIMMYSADEEIQGLFEAFAISGKSYTPQKNEDYLSVINSQIGGTKSDQFIEEKITHETHIAENGFLTNKITIQRTHLWNDSIYFQWKKILQNYGFTEMPDQLIDALGRGRNEVNMRIYVPAESKFIKSNDPKLELKYDKDLKKNYFFTTLEVRAGESKEISVEYLLPFTLDFSEPAANYKLITEKQPGSRGSIFTKKVITDPELENLSVYPQEVRTDSDGAIIYPTNLVYDRYFSGIWSK